MTTSSATQPEGVGKVSDLVAGTTFAMLTTIDAAGELVSRPMAHQGVEGDADVWFFSSRDSRKVEHVRANPQVGVTFASTSTWVSVNGRAEVVADPDKAEQLWSADMEAWFPQGPRDDSIVLIKVTSETAEYWDTPGGRVATVLSLVKSRLTGERYSGGENETVVLDPDH